MKKIMYLAIIILNIGMMACKNDNQGSATTAPVASKTVVTVNANTTESVDEVVAKPVIKSMIQEEKTTLEVVQKDGQIQEIELPKPQVVKQNKPEPQKASPKPASPKPTPTKPKVETTKSTDIKVSPPKVVISRPTTTASSSPQSKTEPKKETPKPVVFSHISWDGLLRKHVSSAGKVNYKGFKADKEILDTYTRLLTANPVQASWSRNKKMAYWINVYNAFTVKMIVDNYPITSITKLDGGKPWDKNWIKLGDETYSLNNIENDILRPKYKDARIHFAVNCAAKSCPPLLNRAWTESNLEGNFKKQAKAFINNPSFNVFTEKKITISKIFEWYAVDFNNIIDYLNKYANITIKANAKVEYKEYNWDLNE